MSHSSKPHLDRTGGAAGPRPVDEGRETQDGSDDLDAVVVDLVQNQPQAPRPALGSSISSDQRGNGLSTYQSTVGVHQQNSTYARHGSTQPFMNQQSEHGQPLAGDAGRSARNRNDSTRPARGHRGRLLQRPAEQMSRQDSVQRLLDEQAEMSRKIQELKAACEQERALRGVAENDLRVTKERLEETRKQWKQLALESNRVKSQNQGFYQITDNYLIELINKLRYDIRAFAIQYFAGKLRIQGGITNTTIWQLCMEPLTLGTHAYQDYLISSSQRPSIIQGFTWMVLLRHVFGKFLWGGEARLAVRELHARFRPPSSRTGPDPVVDADTVRKFQVWSAETTGHLLATLDTNEGSKTQEGIRKAKEEVTGWYWEVATPFLVEKSGDHVQEFQHILNGAMELDRQIHRQVARLEWWFFPKPSRPFDPDIMTLEQGQKPAGPDSEVRLLVAPGIKKRGKSNGDGFQNERWLLPLEVSCQPPDHESAYECSSDVISSLFAKDSQSS